MEWICHTKGGSFMTEKTREYLKKALDESKYTVAICGSGILDECGHPTIKTPSRAYELEEKYGVSPEYIFTDTYFNNRTALFYQFYKNEMLLDLEPPRTAYALAAMERAGKLNCVVTANIYELPARAGCHNVINIHGSIYNNICPRCKRQYPVEYIRNSKKVPLCETCDVAIRPQLSLFGDMLGGSMIAQVAEEVEKADVLLVIGTTLDSEVFRNYIKYFNGSRLIVIHEYEHIMDKNADLVIYDTAGNALGELGY